MRPRDRWLVVVGLVSGLLLCGPALAQGGAGAPEHLRCEYQPNPLGLDVPRPRLSWWLADARRGARQTAYRVLVASRPALLDQDTGDLWDSGRVQSDQSIHVPYGGKPLVSRQRCWWKVRAWDAHGRPSPWSKVAWWEMALLHAGDWRAKWISPSELRINAEPIPLGPWVWHPAAGTDHQTVYFRNEIDLPEDPLPHFTTIAITADDRYELFVNGRRVGAGGNAKHVERYTGAAANFKPGRNLLAVKVTNAGGPAGLTLGVYQSYYGGEHVTLAPADWVCSDHAAKNWEKPDFKADGWLPAKVVGQPGGPPWGTLTQNVDGPRRSQLLRKAFQLPAGVTRARAYVSGLGFYELHINGRRVGNDVFTPGWTQYEKRIQYQVYDVTKLLRAGSNAVGAVLGNGWWSGGLGWAGGQARHAQPGENLRLVMQLEIDCEDGSTHTIVTDRSWTSHTSPIVHDTLYHGETYDARLEQPGWDQPGFAASAWQPVKLIEDPLTKLCAQRGPALRVTQQLEPVRITEPKRGVYVLDFGQNHAGRPGLAVQAPAGTTIRMVHAEYLKPDGTLERANYRSARATDTYICKGGGLEVWQPRFTYRGFRYLQVTGLPGKPTKRTIVSHVLHSAPPRAGTFQCSNRLLNRILRNVQWGQRSNMHSVPTDCPQRDERLGWMGDAQAFAPTAIWNMDMALFFTKWMRDVLQAQQPDGAVPGVCPTVGDWVIGPGRSAWADAITQVPWYVYLYYGDRQILAENYQGNRKWVQFIRSKLNRDGLYEQPTWGDWVPVVRTPDRPIAAMYAYHSTRLLARMARILGHQADAALYDELADAQRAAFNRKHFHRQTNNYVTGTQTSNVLPLAFGLVDPNRRQAVADNIAADVRRRGGHLSTGFLGTSRLLPVLAQYGYADLAYRIVNTDQYPSLGYMIKQGATTIWERWDTDRRDPSMNSRNHFALGSMAQWFYEGLAGLRPDARAPGFKHIIVRPYVVGDLRWVRASYPSMYGKLAAEWRRQEGRLALTLTVPPNATATVYLPAAEAAGVRESGRPAAQAEGVRLVGAEGDRAVLEVSAGQYRFESRLP